MVMPTLITAKRTRGAWTADISGYGVLPVVHSTLWDTSTQAYHSLYTQEDADGAKLAALLKAFADAPDTVLMQKDKPRLSEDDALEADGYVGVFRIKDFIWDEDARTLDFSVVSRENVRFK